ncbi:MAG: NAD(P)/FAD-dependent oxidoreductase [Actinobacteria bacterium]|nr:NAD(P)/FAD-dependent oxidoreductase [Actinomycetota bacterium]
MALVAGGVVILGGGSTGEAFVAALRRLDENVQITLVERELVGGECSYWACMPTKAALRPTEALAAARRVPGAAEALTGELDVQAAFAHRDQVAERDDSGQADYLREHDCELVRGDGRVERAGVVTVGERDLPYDKLVIATGSEPRIPPVEGLAELDFWTNREATETTEVPASLAVIGAGPVGCELAQFFHRAGSRVTVVDTVDRLLPREDPEVGRLLRDQFEEEGILIRCNTKLERVDAAGRLHVAGGEPIEADRVLVATGRKARVTGLEGLALEISKRGVEVDEHMQAAEGVWAIGDVTGIAMFTHVGKYQARVAAENVAGGSATAHHGAIPAVTFTDPQVASVGETQGDGLVSSSYAVEALARTSTYERPKRAGLLKLFADPKRRVLVGAVAIGPEAGEWLGQLTLAVRAEVSVDVLRDTIQPYPTFSEAVFFAVRELPL